MKEVDLNITDMIVVGGGITGLVSAYLAAKAGKKVKVIEGSEHFGGLLKTFEIGDNRVEFYYHHFFTHDAELNWLIKDLNIEDKLIYKKTSMGIFSNGKIYDFNSLVDLLKFKPISFIDKIRFGLSSIFLGKYANWKNFEDRSSIDWLKKWAGTTTTAVLWAPLLNIKFGPYASKIPLSWMIGRLKQRMSSRKKGDEQLGYLKGSLKVLLDALLTRLNDLGVELVSHSPVEKITFERNEIKSIFTENEEHRASNYLFTIPSTYLSKLLGPKTQMISTDLNEIKYFGAVCVILELDRSLSDIYWLNIADEGFPFGGIIEHTNFIPSSEYKNTHIAYLSRYFALEDKIASMSNDEINRLMLEYLPKIYKGFSTDWIQKVNVFKTNTAATVCDLNFSEKVPDCKTEIDNFYIANMSHVYPDERSTNNSVRIAAEACRVMGIDTSYVPTKSSMSGKIGF